MMANRLTREFEIQRLIAYIPFEWSTFENLQICLVFLFCQTKRTTVFCEQRYKYYMHITVYREKNESFLIVALVAKCWKEVPDGGKKELCCCNDLSRFYVRSEKSVNKLSFDVF